MENMIIMRDSGRQLWRHILTKRQFT